MLSAQIIIPLAALRPSVRPSKTRGMERARADGGALHLNTLDFQHGRPFGNRASRNWLILFRHGAKKALIQSYRSPL